MGSKAGIPPKPVTPTSSGSTALWDFMPETNPARKKRISWRCGRYFHSTVLDLKEGHFDEIQDVTPEDAAGVDRSCRNRICLESCGGV
jgi:hypothetical protein